MAVYAFGAGLKSNGELWTWGGNEVGQLGDQSLANRSSPVLVVGNHSFVGLPYNVIVPAAATNISKVSGVAKASIKKISGIAIASIKKVSGVTN